MTIVRDASDIQIRWMGHFFFIDSLDSFPCFNDQKLKIIVILEAPVILTLKNKCATLPVNHEVQSTLGAPKWFWSVFVRNQMPPDSCSAWSASGRVWQLPSHDTTGENGLHQLTVTPKASLNNPKEAAAVLTVLNQLKHGSTTTGSSTPNNSTNQILKLKLGPCDMIGTGGQKGGSWVKLKFTPTSD